MATSAVPLEEDEESDVFQPPWMQLVAMIAGGVLCCCCNFAVCLYVYRSRRRTQDAPGQGLAMVIDHVGAAGHGMEAASYSPDRDRSIRSSRQRNGSDRSNVTYSNVPKPIGHSYSKQSSLGVQRVPPHPNSLHASSSPGSSVAPSDRGDMKGVMGDDDDDEEEGQLSDGPVPTDVARAILANNMAMRSSPRGMAVSNRLKMRMKPYEQWLVEDIVHWINTLWFVLGVLSQCGHFQNVFSVDM